MVQTQLVNLLVMLRAALPNRYMLQPLVTSVTLEERNLNMATTPETCEFLTAHAHAKATRSVYKTIQPRCNDT